MSLKGNPLKEITDPLEIQKTLQQEKNIAERGEMWITLKDQIILVPFTLVKVDLDDQVCWCKLERDEEQYSRIFGCAPEIKCFFPSSGTYIFSTVHSFRIDSQILVINLPKLAYSKERREHERFDLDGKMSLQIKNDVYSRSYRVFDISKGGLSIILSKRDPFPFEEEKLIGELKPFGIRLKVQVTAVVKIKPFVFESIPYAGKKISMQFEFSSPEKEEKWQKFWPELLREVV